MAAEPRQVQAASVYYEQLRKRVTCQYVTLVPGSWVRGWSGLWFRPSPWKHFDDDMVRAMCGLQIRDCRNRHFNLDCTLGGVVSIVSCDKQSNPVDARLSQTYPDFLSFATDVANTINAAKGEAHAG